ncbi:MAG: hypothetical protein ABI862_19730 [Ilumatobacteraceae bacterium]
MANDSYRNGAVNEGRFAAWAISKGSSVIQVAQGQNWAPRLATWASDVGPCWDGGRKIVLPDLQVHHRTEGLCWVEVKGKSTAVEYRHAHEMRTGIDRRLLVHYRRIEQLTGYPVRIVFCHERENDVRWVRVAEREIRGVGNGSEMSYWAWDSMPRLCSLDELSQCSPAVNLWNDEPLFGPAVNHVQQALW